MTLSATKKYMIRLRRFLEKTGRRCFDGTDLQNAV
jgi:hypothetical protein